MGAWVEIILAHTDWNLRPRRSLCGSVGWNRRAAVDQIIPRRRSLCGSVGWNKNNFAKVRKAPVAPFVGAWVEIAARKTRLRAPERRSLCGSVGWNLSKLETNYYADLSLPLWECGLKSQGEESCRICMIVAPFVGAWIEVDIVLAGESNPTSVVIK